MSNTKLTPNKFDTLAVELIEFIQKNNMFSDINIYVNGDKLSSNLHHGDEIRTTRYGEFYVTKNVDVTTILEYCNPETISMTFEGPLNHEINYGDGKITTKLRNIFAKYDLWFEQGYAWSLTAYYN